MLKSNDIQQRPRQPIRQMLTHIPQHPGKTAWIFGAGPGIDYVKDWHIPDGVIVIGLNGGVLACSERMNYWFAIDHTVVTPGHTTEWMYAKLALYHPTAIKILISYLQAPDDCPNLFYANMKRDYQGLGNLNENREGGIVRGNTVLIPALSFCYYAGIKNIILSGTDMCRYNQKRHFFDVASKGHNYGREVQAPNGEWVYLDGQMSGHMTVVMRLIRDLQAKGINIYKTTSSGMLEIPYIESDKAVKHLCEGGVLRTKVLDNR